MSTYRGSITLTSISEGRGYGIETNREKINRFYNNDNQIGYSATSITINAYLSQDSTKTDLDVSQYTLEIWSVDVSGDTTFGVFKLLNKLSGRKKGTSDTPTSLLSIAREVSNNKYIIFKFADLIDYEATSSSSSTTAEQTKDIDNFNSLIDLIQNENFYFLLKIYPYVVNYEVDDTNTLAIKPVVFEYGTSEDMAKFAVTANSIQAAIDNTGMVFDANGLTITNGGFKIQREYEDPEHAGQFLQETLLQYANNELQIKGSGTFTGTVNANQGSFTGTVVAQSLEANVGNIGGFVLTNEGLFSSSGYVENVSQENQTAVLQLYGGSGAVVANTITLGTGANIADYLKIGNAYLYNPTLHNDVLLDVNWNNYYHTGIQLTQTGILKLGKITLDGLESKIYGTNFTITPDWSEFNNVSVKGKIVTAVFETDKVQAAGGAMIFKPSYKVKSQSSNVLTLEEEFTGEVGNYVYLVEGEGKFKGRTTVTNINSNDKTIITVGTDALDTSIFSVIDLGKVNSVIIGINSGDSFGQYLYPRGLTISDLKADSIDEKPKVFLGDLGSIGLTGNGLYGENVFLTGSLTTKTITNNEESYAGVNTLNGAQATVFNGSNVVQDNSEIIFWAGSSDITVGAIQGSPFQVTRNGSLYSSQGLFEGAIISRSKIQGADVYAARIHGTGNVSSNPPEPGLSFYDTDNGIAFFKGEYDQNPVQTFYMGTAGLAYSSNDKYFIKIEESKVKSSFNNLVINQVLDNENIPKLELTDEGKIYGKYGGNNAAHIKLDSNVDIKIDETRGISIVPSQLQLIHGETLVTGVFNLGNKLQYKQVTENNVLVGYNLYIN